MQNNNTKRERLEEKVKKELRLWVKDQHPSWLIYPTSVTHATLSKGHLRQAYRFSPDIDVLAFYKAENELISFEVKAPIYRYKNFYFILDEKGNIEGWQPYSNSFIRELKKEGKIDKKKIKAEAKLGIIYESIGEAFFNLRYVDLSFIVLPNLKSFYPDHTHPIFTDILMRKILPLGLIEYEYFFSPSQGPGLKISEAGLRIKKFRESYKAESLSIWKDYNTYIGYAENNFIWEEEGAVSTIREHLINQVKENHI